MASIMWHCGVREELIVAITNVKVGDRVYPYPLNAKDDRKRAGTLGGFSEYILMPNAKLNHSYYMVDDSISDRVASLIEV